jgi:hypothetical protein
LQIENKDASRRLNAQHDVIGKVHSVGPHHDQSSVLRDNQCDRTP